MGTGTPTVKSSCLPQTANSSSPVRRPVPVTRTWIRCPSFDRVSEPTLANSWIAGALDSAWRAVEQYLNINKIILPPGMPKKFHDSWRETEYWDEDSNNNLAKSDKELMKRQLVIGLYEPGTTLRAK